MCVYGKYKYNESMLGKGLLLLDTITVGSAEQLCHTAMMTHDPQADELHPT